MFASAGVRFALSRLHGTQHDTMFSHDVRPPRDRGTTWSYVSCAIVHFVPQY